MLKFGHRAPIIFFETNTEILAVAISRKFRDLIAFQVRGLQKLGSLFHSHPDQIIIEINPIFILIKNGQIAVVNIKMIGDVVQCQARIAVFRQNIAADLG